MISLKDFISKSPSALGSLNFIKSPKIIIENEDRHEAGTYNDLKSFELPKDKEGLSEKEWADARWQGILEAQQNRIAEQKKSIAEEIEMLSEDRLEPEAFKTQKKILLEEKANIESQKPFYDGDVTAVIDVIYDETSNELRFIMARMKYSLASAMGNKNYPNPERRKDFVSFGIGMMANMEVNSDSLNSDLLMMRRSTKVLNEQNAISVPGGSLEYKSGKKDDVEKGMGSAVLSEVEEEVYPRYKINKRSGVKEEITPTTNFQAGLMSIGWERNVGINAYFNVTANNRKISQDDLKNRLKFAKDKYEHSGSFFVDTAGNDFAHSSQDESRVTVGQIINSGKLEASGTHALSAKIFSDVSHFYEMGCGFGLMPNTDALAEKFLSKKIPSFTFLDASRFNYKTPRAICSKPELGQNLKNNDKEENRSK